MSENFLYFTHPFTCMVSGPTSSGKTYLVRNIIKNYKTLIKFQEKINIINVQWAYGQEQNLYKEPIGDNVNIQYIQGLPTEDEIGTFSPKLLIIDDLMSDLGDNKDLANLFSRGSHHLGVSVIFITQNLFHQGKQMRTIGLNCHYFIIMKSVRGKAQLSHFCRDVFPGKSKYLLEAYDDATSNDPYSYIKVDLTQQTLEKFRVSTKIIPEKAIFRPVFYIPR